MSFGTGQSERPKGPPVSPPRPGAAGGLLVWVTSAVLSTTALCTLAWWMGTGSSVPVVRRVPIPENAPREGAVSARAAVNIEGTLQKFDGTAGATRGEWPRFRGSRSDNVCGDSVRIASPPKVLWSLDLGDGHAGAAVLLGRVFVLDHDEAMHADALRCFSFDDGREIWRRSYKVQIKRNHGISRTVPAVTDRHVVAIGPMCHVLCADPKDGRFLWGMDLVKEFGSTVPLWYTAQCPIIEGGIAILAPAGSALMIGVDCATGKVVWRTPNPGGWQMSHSSVVPATFAGRRMYVYAAIGGVAGVAADGPDAGRLLWSTTEWNHPVVAPSPVALDGDRLLLTAGYGAGSMLVRIEPDGDAYRAKVLERIPKERFACEQQTPVYFKGHLYGILPKDAGELKAQLVCYDPEKGVVWSSGKAVRFGLGPFIIAGDRIIVLNDDGGLVAAKASTDRYEPILRARALDGRDAWAPIAVAGGRILLRDSHRMVCLDAASGT
ncbi:MAG TPA: PQQ-binding-like beta-propeller repeat protein [Verrucomicrobiae bacterium]|nr:PQQ-binding-like beta-propeller repeat protein [Verrucomicrobiae bacterium]